MPHDARAAPFPLYDAAVRVYTIWTMPPDGLEIVAEFDAEAPRTLMLVDRSYGLPPDGSFLTAARPAWSAPVGSGDLTIVSATVTVPSPGLTATARDGARRP